MSTAPRQTQPTCPRCDYDLAGQVRSWEIKCPLEGTCSECGLKLRWQEVLVAHITPPRWSFEHAVEVEFVPMLRTFFRAVRPKWLFTSLRLEHRVSTPRLALFVPLALVLAYIVQTLAYLALFTVGNLLAMLQSAVQGPATRDSQIMRVEIIGKATWPWSPTHRGKLDWAEFTYIMNPGVPDLYGLLVDLLDDADPRGIVILLIAALLMPLLFALVPQTRKRYKIRPRHLVRVGVYSLAWLPLAATGGALVDAVTRMIWPLAMMTDPTLMDLSYIQWSHKWLTHIGWLVLGVGYLALWWRGTIRRYLRLPRPTLIMLAFLTIAIATALIIVLTTGLVRGEQLMWSV